MTVALYANDSQWEEIAKDAGMLNCTRINSIKDITNAMDAFIILDSSLPFDFDKTTKPILVNQVIIPLTEMNTPENVIRINGWNSFIARTVWEAAGIITEPAQQLFLFLKKQLILVPDEPGFISARIIAMIINEAYFALGEEVSTKEEINIAMRLGTNYPFGPFEWASVIGVNNIYMLLQKLSMADKRYLPAPLLKQEADTWV